MSKHKQSAGFTLLELMIAVVIFSIMSLMAYGGLKTVLDSNETTQSFEADLKELQRTMMFLEKDLRQLAARPRHANYNEMQGALVTDLGVDGLIEFTRAGNPNPAGKMRSSLQRVRYVVVDGALQRWSWDLVDHLDGKPVVMTLLSSVEGLSFRFMQNKQWQDEWVSSDLKALPKAIEINIKTKRWGDIRRLLSIYG